MEGKGIPLKIFKGKLRFPADWTINQRMAGKMIIASVFALLGFIAWLGVAVMIGYFISMFMCVGFLAWIEEQEKKKKQEFDE